MMAMTKQKKKKVAKDKKTRQTNTKRPYKAAADKEANSRGILVLQQRSQLIIEHAMQLSKASQNLLVLLAEANHGLDISLKNFSTSAAPMTGQAREQVEQIHEKVSRALELIDGQR